MAEIATTLHCEQLPPNVWVATQHPQTRQVQELVVDEPIGACSIKLYDRSLQTEEVCRRYVRHTPQRIAQIALWAAGIDLKASYAITGQIEPPTAFSMPSGDAEAAVRHATIAAPIIRSYFNQGLLDITVLESDGPTFSLSQQEKDLLPLLARKGDDIHKVVWQEFKELADQYAQKDSSLLTMFSRYLASQRLALPPRDRHIVHTMPRMYAQAITPESEAEVGMKANSGPNTKRLRKPAAAADRPLRTISWQADAENRKARLQRHDQFVSQLAAAPIEPDSFDGTYHFLWKGAEIAFCLQRFPKPEQQTIMLSTLGLSEKEIQAWTDPEDAGLLLRRVLAAMGYNSRIGDRTLFLLHNSYLRVFGTTSVRSAAIPPANIALLRQQVQGSEQKEQLVGTYSKNEERNAIRYLYQHFDVINKRQLTLAAMTHGLLAPHRRMQYGRPRYRRKARQ